MNNMHHKKKLIETFVYWVLNENEEIDTIDAIVEVLNSLYFDTFCLWIMNP